MTVQRQTALSLPLLGGRRCSPRSVKGDITAYETTERCWGLQMHLRGTHADRSGGLGSIEAAGAAIVHG
jgi:hypothetical protein